MNNPIILFDGVCNFCNSAVNFIIRNDQKNRYSFAPLQSSIGQKLLAEHNLPGDSLSTFILIEKGKAYTRSTAALRIARHLSGLLPMLYIFIIIPPFFRDIVYKVIAANRYKWFGRRDQCMIPTPELRARFLE